MLVKLHEILRKNKALSKLITILIIVATFSVLISGCIIAINFTVIKNIREQRALEEAIDEFVSNIQIGVSNVTDTNKDSLYEEMTLLIENGNDQSFSITSINSSIAEFTNINNPSFWSNSLWTSSTENISITSSESLEVNIYTLNQFELTITKLSYLFFEFIIQTNDFSAVFSSNWIQLNELAYLGDIINDHQYLNLEDEGFVCISFVPGTYSNYETTGGPEYGPLIADSINYLPVINESEAIGFYYSGLFTVFHSLNGNLTYQPTIQQINRTTDPVKAQILFLLGLAGSWGDEFPSNSHALTIDITYTDGSHTIWQLGHEYIDDLMYASNIPHECTSAPYGKITEIDLGNQISIPNEHIHTHTFNFQLDFYKYIQYISFIDPGNDGSGPHLLAITLG